MRALVYDKELVFKEDYPMPDAPGEALIKVLMSGICNTDIEIAKGYMGFTGVLGHEFVGIVEAAPDADLVGRRVAGEINCPCRECDYCKRGVPNHCPGRSVLGILKRDGTFAEYCTLPPENLHVVPDGMRNEEAVFAEPLAAAFRITEQVRISPADNVVVLGDGKLGLLVAQVMKATGCNLLAVGLSPVKLSILEKLGIETSLAGEVVRKKFDIAIDCTGASDGFETALSLIRPMGTLVLKTTLAEELTLDTSRIVINEITVIGSRCGPFRPALNALAARTISVEPLISDIVPFSRALEAFDIARKKDTLKVILKM